MAVKHVEIHEVGEDQTVRRSRPKILDLLHSLCVGRCRMRFAHAFARKNIADLTDSDDLCSFVLDGVENCARRFYREIVSSRRSPKAAFGPIEWPRDHASNAIFIGATAGDFADLV